MVALMGYGLFVVLAWACAWFSVQPSLSSTIRAIDRARFWGSILRVEAFTRAICLNLLLGAAAICCTAGADEPPWIVMLGAIFALVNIIVASKLATILRDVYTRSDNETEYGIARRWRTLTFALVALSLVFSALRQFLKTTGDRNNGGDITSSSDAVPNGQKR